MPRARMLDPGTSLAACLGALLRHLRTLRGLTQAGLGAAAGFDGSYVGAVERAAVRPSRDLVERCDRALGAGGVLLALWPPADAEWQARSTPAGAGHPPTDDPDASRPSAGRAGDESEAVVEAMEVARRVEACDVGPGTLAGIERAVQRLRGAGAATPPELLIPAVRAQRGYVGRLLAGRLTLGRRRRLLVAAGWLSLELARLHFDAGERAAAEANRDAALRLARQAGDAELAACAVEALAAWALADGRWRDALELARAGQDLAPPASVAALQLALDEAQAWTSLGDPMAAAGARRQAALTRAMLPGAGFPLPGTAPPAAAAS
jgi:transcriptional regulator with XRE-family HTH domain